MRSLARRFSPDIRQIDLDVNRTYRDHIDFRERYGERQVRKDVIRNNLLDVFAGHASIYSRQFPMLKFFGNGGQFLVLPKPCHVILISVARIRSGR